MLRKNDVDYKFQNNFWNWDSEAWYVSYKTYVILALISTLATIIIATMKIPIIFQDPLLTTKRNFMNFQLIMIVISIISSMVAILLFKNKEVVVQILKFIAIITILMIAVQVTIKLNIDNKYNEEAFGEFYEQITSNSNEEGKVYLMGMFGREQKNDKESYIQYSVDTFNKFKLKTTLYIIIHIIVEIIIVYLVNKVKMTQKKKEKMDKDVFYSN